MEAIHPKNVFSKLGFAQTAGIAASIIVGRFVLTPLVAESKLPNLFNLIGGSGLLLLIYVPQLAYLLAFGLMVRSMPREDWQKESLGFKTLAEIFMMMYVVSSLLNQIGSMITKASPVGENFQLDLISKMESTKLPVAIMIPVVIGPILEELIFRKLMLDRTRRFGEKTAVIFSAICFGLFHGNLTQFLYAGCVGLFLGYVYCKTGKVIYTMIMHMLLNGMSSVIVLLLPSFESLGSDAAPEAVALPFLGLVFILLLIGVMSVMGVILLVRWIKQKRFILDDSMPECIPADEVLKTVYLNPGVILLFAITVFEITADLLNLTLFP